ncbi:MAG TPA: hypothetical protein DEB30_05430 [Candidatus Peribacter riflensis]|uniref:Inner membrane protein n=1 Tax=Candidatus Peribacter riflensis TaxID=1735162 RepID=A0A0S1SLB0_9BACT|nr:MAG: inner membrane protein [Candidatus Peribacter riflensis]OGJ76688.1 MAG: hypothetical protein A2398_03590 [Candidatus Peribacteria bacterium RIFOXYB1_FULL_57_12]ALM10608.1 MAG: inner membrane protein [Candidatus Peribacter riflensis]ALM11710.1 MAG: inner membrane protein [Candidatus Peribacter riflensis]ALM12813.1 MAG: inner membrane protein [Candidatus Peribacter riflensis]
MPVLTHILSFLLATSVIWFLSGILIDATDQVAKRYHKPGFAVAFFVLGFLTSISEMSVAVNATAQGIPQVSAGNLQGASLVIILFIIPLLAVLGNGVPMTRVMLPSTVALLLFVVLLPALFALDGTIMPYEGAFMLLLYGGLILRIRKKVPARETASKALRETKETLTRTRYATAMDIAKIILGAALIFIAGNVLVDESAYFARLLHLPLSFVGLLLLSIGTNFPELVVALRCVLGRHKDIAFGDYMGSAAANTLIFGVLAIANGAFTIIMSEAVLTCAVSAIGFTLFFLFARTKEKLSRTEGSILLVLYGLFLLFQILNALRLPDDVPLEAMNSTTRAAATVVE